MRYFIDTEFNDDGVVIDLISIAVVAEDGREMYLVSTEFNPENCDDWVKTHVLPLLPPKEDLHWKSRKAIRKDLVAFIGDDTKPMFYAYFADYDFVVLCQLFGKMINLPKHFPNFCMDLKQTMVEHDVQKRDLPVQQGVAHDALEDARWNKKVFEYLMARRTANVSVPR